MAGSQMHTRPLQANETRWIHSIDATDRSFGLGPEMRKRDDPPWVARKWVTSEVLAPAKMDRDPGPNRRLKGRSFKLEVVRTGRCSQ